MSSAKKADSERSESDDRRQIVTRSPRERRSTPRHDEQRPRRGLRESDTHMTDRATRTTSANDNDQISAVGTLPSRRPRGSDTSTGALSLGKQSAAASASVPISQESDVKPEACTRDGGNSGEAKLGNAEKEIAQVGGHHEADPPVSAEESQQSVAQPSCTSSSFAKRRAELAATAPQCAPLPLSRTGRRGIQRHAVKILEADNDGGSLPTPEVPIHPSKRKPGSASVVPSKS